jgi:hypothetical protein
VAVLRVDGTERAWALQATPMPAKEAPGPGKIACQIGFFVCICVTVVWPLLQASFGVWREWRKTCALAGGKSQHRVEVALLDGEPFGA